jgi:hypothetical protein
VEAIFFLKEKLLPLHYGPLKSCSLTIRIRVRVYDWGMMQITMVLESDKICQIEVEGIIWV